jgi:hypothetical protein
MFACSVCVSSFAAAVALLAFDALLLVGEQHHVPEHQHERRDQRR